MWWTVCLCHCCSKNGKLQKRGKMNLIGRLQLSTERSKEEDNDGIVQLRILRVQVGGRFHCPRCDEHSLCCVTDCDVLCMQYFTNKYLINRLAHFCHVKLIC